MPSSPCASAPSTGPVNRTPRAASAATLAWVAGLVHIPACIAGATTIGPRNSSAVALSRSSARPCASLASVLAVAGAITSDVGALREVDVNRRRRRSHSAA